MSVDMNMFVVVVVFVCGSSAVKVGMLMLMQITMDMDMIVYISLQIGIYGSTNMKVEARSSIISSVTDSRVVATFTLIDRTVRLGRISLSSKGCFGMKELHIPLT
jgi:hypothetical protein